MKKWFIICALFGIIFTYGCLTDNMPPTIPVGLTSITGDGCVYLYWYPNQERDLAYYGIYRSDVPDGYYVEIAISTDAIFVDCSVTNGET